MPKFTEEEIEIVARQLCCAHGLDPDAEVQCVSSAGETVAEYFAHVGNYADHSLSMPRWRLFRRDASKYLAAHFVSL